MGTFDDGVAAWRDKDGLLRDQIRQELVARQLADAVEARRGPRKRLQVLDVGCGQGTQAIRLARAGHEVLGIDLSNSLLTDATETRRSEPPAVQSRVRFLEGDIAALPDAFSDRFDLVCCHGVVMYLDDLSSAVAQLAKALRDGGLLSLLTKNQANLAMRAAMTGDWRGALQGFDAGTYTNRLGIQQVRADTPDEVSTELVGAGFELLAWHGVRLFTDHHGDVEAPADIDLIIEAEQEAGRRDPYRQLAALTHSLAVLG